jgi:hypothetical protein
MTVSRQLVARMIGYKLKTEVVIAISNRIIGRLQDCRSCPTSFVTSVVVLVLHNPATILHRYDRLILPLICSQRY